MIDNKEEGATDCAPLIHLTVNTKSTTRLQSVDHIFNGETKSPSDVNQISHKTKKKFEKIFINQYKERQEQDGGLNP